MSDDGGTLICSPVELTPAAVATPGSVQRWCSICGELVWVSATGQALLAERPKMQPICLRCAPGSMAADGAKSTRMDRRTVEELRGLGVPDEEIRAMKRLTDRGLGVGDETS